MKTFSDDDIMNLISCKKNVVQPPRKDMKLDRASYRNDMQLESEDGSVRFSVFMRRNQEFMENFSIGLCYHSREGDTFNLLRFNGPHGLNIGLEPGTHYSYHIHRADAENLNDGCFSERRVNLTAKYASYEEAMNYFIKAVGIVDADKYFPPIDRQLMLFTEEG